PSQEAAVLRAQITVQHAPLSPGHRLSTAGVERTHAAARDQQVELVGRDAAVVDDLDDHHLAVQRRVVLTVVTAAIELELIASTPLVVAHGSSREPVRQVRPDLPWNVAPAHVCRSPALARVHAIVVATQAVIALVAAHHRVTTRDISFPAAGRLAAVPVARRP